MGLPSLAVESRRLSAEKERWAFAVESERKPCHRRANGDGPSSDCEGEADPSSSGLLDEMEAA
jgi:hypothetical protein